MGFRGYWGLGTRTPLHVQKPGDSSSPPKLLQRLQSGQRRGSGSGDHSAERWETALSRTWVAKAPAVQPLQGVLASLVLSTGTPS